jgi:hypothetical protein
VPNGLAICDIGVFVRGPPRAAWLRHRGGDGVGVVPHVEEERRGWVAKFHFSMRTEAELSRVLTPSGATTGCTKGPYIRALGEAPQGAGAVL